MDYILNENTMNKFEEFNSLKGKGDYSDVFKNYIANAINYIGTYYPEKLLAQKDNILSNKALSNCVNDLEKLVKIAELNNQIEVSTFVSTKVINLKNDLLSKTIGLAKSGQFDKIDFLQKEYGKIENNYNIYKDASLSDTLNQGIYLNQLNEVNKQIYINIFKEISFEAIEDFDIKR